MNDRPKNPPSRSIQTAAKGQSMVEFAFGMVVIIILLAGIVDVGRAMFTYMALRESAQEGAQYGATNPTASADIISRVCNTSNLMQGLNCGEASDPSNTVKVEVTLIGPACAGFGIRVGVDYSNFPITMPFLGTLIGSQEIGISTSATDTILSPLQCP